MIESRPLVAVVDDEASVRASLMRLLRASRLDCVGFASGEEFLTSLATCRPDCLVIDLQMSGLNGRDVQRRLASLARPIPVIIITAHDEPTIREQCLADGASAYLRKPLRSGVLIRSIQSAMGFPTEGT
jgi:FixJ family two-component response regulator